MKVGDIVERGTSGNRCPVLIKGAYGVNCVSCDRERGHTGPHALVTFNDHTVYYVHREDRR